MPAFVTAPPSITPRRGLQEGLPGYSLGSFALGQSPTKFYVTSVAVATNVVTLGVRLVEGNIPAVGNLISVVGTVAGGAPVNVTRAALTGVTITAATGVGTVTYAATTGNLGTTPDGGTAFVDVPEVGETTAIQKCLQFALPQPAGPALETGRVITWAWASTAATLAIQLEAAIDDLDAQYTIVGASQTTLTGTIVGNVPLAMRFVRVNLTNFTGGPGATWAKILI